MSLSSQMLKSPLAFSAALYAFQFVVRYLRRPQFVSLIIRAYYRCGPDLNTKDFPTLWHFLMCGAKMERGDADKNLDWFYAANPRLARYSTGLREPKGYLDPLFLVPADVVIDHFNELLDGRAFLGSRRRPPGFE